MDYILFIAAFVSSFVFSLGGIGGAIILIPIMVFMGIPIATAKPVGLFGNVVSLSGASISNYLNKRIDFKIGLPIIGFSFVFASVGAYVSKYIPQLYIMLLYIGFLIFSGSMFLFFKSKNTDDYRTDQPFIKLSLIGVVSGLMSGLLGIGGGSVIAPLMLMMGYNPKKIATTTAFVVPFAALSGFLTYWSMGVVNWHILVIVSVAGTAGAMVGNSFMQNKLDAKMVKKILAVVLLLVAAKMAYSLDFV
ncbi:MAG: sulfite exporter TauE/SafE family protein [Ichthyobacteriaceae bacterium]|nr:sulfite exporter TauE/SafE family protein [Ichthyobacteriaceae bacterium]